MSAATFDGIRSKCCPANNNQAGNDRRPAVHSGLITPVVIRVYSRRYVRFATIKRRWRRWRIFPNYYSAFIWRIASRDGTLHEIDGPFFCIAARRDFRCISRASMESLYFCLFHLPFAFSHSPLSGESAGDNKWMNRYTVIQVYELNQECWIWLIN